MADKLIVKNFGPINEAEIEVKDMMVFIGAQSSGKSTLAKLITILNDFNFKSSYSSSFIKELGKYNLRSFLKKSTEITYESLYFKFKYSGGKEDKIDYNRFLQLNLSKKEHTEKDIETILLIIGLMIAVIHKDGKTEILFREIQKNKHYGLNDKLKSIINEKFDGISSVSEMPENLLKIYQKEISLKELKKLASIVTQVYSFIRPMDSMYIPAERTILPLIVNNIAGLINNEIVFPQYVLQAVQEYEKSIQTVEDIDLGIIGNLRFKRVDGKSFIYHNRNQKVLLREASSGVQSILPILLLVESSVKKENYINLNYVVEEPELNLYPEAQYGLIKYLVNQCLETDHRVQSKNLIITTHSPYILAAINNLLLAYKNGKNQKEKVNEIVHEKSWICYENFNAYQVIDGTVERILDDDEKLIDSNIIDEVSEIILEDFKRIAQLDG